MVCILLCSDKTHTDSDYVFAVTDVRDGSLANGSDVARIAFETRKVIDGFHHIVSAPQRAPFPVIAAIHGHVIGLRCCL
jgi:enoyl-CoA hydratase/carnithine racemase